MNVHSSSSIFLEFRFQIQVILSVANSTTVLVVMVVVREVVQRNTKSVFYRTGLHGGVYGRVYRKTTAHRRPVPKRFFAGSPERRWRRRDGLARFALTHTHAVSAGGTENADDPTRRPPRSLALTRAPRGRWKVGRPPRSVRLKRSVVTGTATSSAAHHHSHRSRGPKAIVRLAVCPMSFRARENGQPPQSPPPPPPPLPDGAYETRLDGREPPSRTVFENRKILAKYW